MPPRKKLTWKPDFMALAGRWRPRRQGSLPRLKATMAAGALVLGLSHPAAALTPQQCQAVDYYVLTPALQAALTFRETLLKDPTCVFSENEYSECHTSCDRVQGSLQRFYDGALARNVNEIMMPYRAARDEQVAACAEKMIGAPLLAIIRDIGKTGQHFARLYGMRTGDLQRAYSGMCNSAVMGSPRTTVD